MDEGLPRWNVLLIGKIRREGSRHRSPRHKKSKFELNVPAAAPQPHLRVNVKCLLDFETHNNKLSWIHFNEFLSEKKKKNTLARQQVFDLITIRDPINISSMNSKSFSSLPELVAAFSCDIFWKNYTLVSWNLTCLGRTSDFSQTLPTAFADLMKVGSDSHLFISCNRILAARPTHGGNYCSNINHHPAIPCRSIVSRSPR